MNTFGMVDAVLFLDDLLFFPDAVSSRRFTRDRHVVRAMEKAPNINSASIGLRRLRHW
jgi:hypothetical protein